MFLCSIEIHPKDVKAFPKESVVNSTLVKGENPSLKSGIHVVNLGWGWGAGGMMI